MPSIFIWKADVPNTSTKWIRYYSGSNWFLEDNDYNSNSYIYLHQIVIPGYDNSAITFHVKKMPQDWVGSELLEVNQLPYRFIQSDKFGTLEHIGNWMRFITHNDIPMTERNIELEFASILEWATKPSFSTSQLRKSSHSSHSNIVTTHKVKKVQDHDLHSTISNMDPQIIHQKLQTMLHQCKIQRSQPSMSSIQTRSKSFI